MIERNIDKKERYEKLLAIRPDAMIILGTVIKETKSRKLEWRTGSFADRDANSGCIVGGRERVEAVAELSKYFPESKIVTASSLRDLDKPSLASVMKRELTLMGVPEEKIIPEEESLRTIDGLKNSIALAYKYGWKNIIIITGDYHVERLDLMVKELGKLADPQRDSADFQEGLKILESGKLIIKVVSAKEVLVIKDPRYSRYFEKAEKTSEYREREEMEAKGLKDLREGQYKIR